MPPEAPEPLAAIAAPLRARIEEFVALLVVRIESEIEYYRIDGVVSHRDLEQSVRSNLDYMIRGLSEGGQVELSAPFATGQRRAEQGAPLPELLRAMRIGFAFFWDQLHASADAMGPEALSVLLTRASEIWRLADEFSTATTEGYRTATARQLVAADRRRSALVAALIDHPQSEQTAWEIARLLGMPYDGSFLVVVVETSEDQSTPASAVLETAFSLAGVASAWHVRPAYEVGILSLGRKDPDVAIQAIRTAVARPAGISAVYTNLDESARAMRSALVAMEAVGESGPLVRQFAASPLSDLAIGDLETSRRFVQRVLGPVLALPADDREILISTAEAWFEARGSAADASRILYCHANTVRYRMHRLEEHLGLTLDEPTAVAELGTALTVLRTVPWIEGITHDDQQPTRKAL